MSIEKNQQEKDRLHARNRNRGSYDLAALIVAIPELAAHVKPNKYGNSSIDFSNPIAVKLLNKALLNHYYGISYWEFPADNLCPPIPGRADYIHYMADLLAENNFGAIPTGTQITCLDIGVGASCIYPIIGVSEYGWKFIGSDINTKSVDSAKQIVNTNPILKDKISCRLQPIKSAIFEGIIDKDERIDLTICNPPFHASMEEALQGTRRKVKNLSGKKTNFPELNFAGISKELICEGGESKFIHDMITESKKFSKNCFWFSTLVSKKSKLPGILKSLEKAEAAEARTINTGTGNKSGQIIAWTFLTKAEQQSWRATKWKTQKLKQD